MVIGGALTVTLGVADEKSSRSNKWTQLALVGTDLAVA